MDVDLTACTSGDKRAWDAFVDRCSGVIYAAVHRTIGRGGEADVPEVDDTVQEVFIRLIRNDYRLLRTFDPDRAALSTWLTLVARSVAIDHLRKKRLKTRPLESHQETAAPTPTSGNITVPLHLVSPRQRLVLRMLFEEGMTVTEAARIIGVDEQTIRSTKHKALTRLREHLAPVDGDTPRNPPV